MSFNKQIRRLKIRKSIRSKIFGTKSRPRVSVFKSNKAIYAQIIDDQAQATLCCASTLDKDLRTTLNVNAGSCDASTAVGELVAQRALAKGIQQVVFDRGGNIYHGRVKALAEAARGAGLKF